MSVLTKAQVAALLEDISWMSPKDGTRKIGPEKALRWAGLAHSHEALREMAEVAQQTSDMHERDAHALRARVETLEKALRGVLPMTEHHDRVCALRRSMPDCDCGERGLNEIQPEIIAARAALEPRSGDVSGEPKGGGA